MGLTARAASVVAQNGLGFLNESTQARFMVPMIHVELQYVLLGQLGTADR
jgi:hypothetical protein